MKRPAVRRIALHAMLAALYTACSLAFAPISFGAVQIRVAEMFSLLPALHPACILSVTFGCFLTNLLGFVLGLNPFAADIAVGTLATLLAACLTFLARNVTWGRVRILAPLPPVLINAVFIGAELTVLQTDALPLVPFLWNALSVGLGQLIPCYLFGSVLLYYLEKTALFSDVS